MILQSDACQQPLADKSVHCCVTSPPFFGLRNYGVPPSHWPAMTYVPMSGAAPISIGAMACCLGLEPTPEAYVGHLVEVLREVKRTLRDDGTFFLNLGDSYASSAFSARHGGKGEGITGDKAHHDIPRPPVPPGLKPKDLVGIPWRVAFALQADGWYLRSDIIWSKTNPMPESVRDRPTKAHEYMFLLSKSKRYFYDGEAVKEPSTMHSADWNEDGTQKRKSFKRGHGNAKNSDPGKEPFRAIAATRNRRTVWTISTKPYKGAHFATFPPDLIEPCIKAGTSERGCCPECGAPWERVTERREGQDTSWKQSVNPSAKFIERRARGLIGDGSGLNKGTASYYENRPQTTTTGWRPTCKCYDGLYRQFTKPRKARKRAQRDAWGGRWKRVRRRPGLDSWDTEPCIVLDPFGGAGTTKLEAERLGRCAVVCELKGEYCQMARERTKVDMPLFDFQDAAS